MAQQVSAKLVAFLPSGEEVVVGGNATANADGTIKVTFEDFRFPGEYSLYVSVDGVSAQGSPLPNALLIDPEDNGLPVYALIIMVVGVVLLLAGMFVYGKRLKKYRGMIKKNKELTERGREQWECQNSRKMQCLLQNPLASMTAEDLKRLIEENETKIKHLEATTVDPAALRRQVEILKDEGSKLREEMGKLKMDKQMLEVSHATKSSRRVDRTKEKKEFGQRKLRNSDLEAPNGPHSSV